MSVMEQEPVRIRRPGGPGDDGSVSLLRCRKCGTVCLQIRRSTPSESRVGWGPFADTRWTHVPGLFRSLSVTNGQMEGLVRDHFTHFHLTMKSGAGGNRTLVRQAVTARATTIPESESLRLTHRRVGWLAPSASSFREVSVLSHRQWSFPPSIPTSVAGL